MLSVPDIGWGSVIGNTLDHGMTYLPYGVDMNMACGLEVVLADGSLLRTGMGAMPGNSSWHLYKRGLGPTLDQLFMQSNFGIVTKMGVWLMPEPEVYMPLWARVWRDDDLGAVCGHAAAAFVGRHDPLCPADLEHGDLRVGGDRPSSCGGRARVRSRMAFWTRWRASSRSAAG